MGTPTSTQADPVALAEENLAALERELVGYERSKRRERAKQVAGQIKTAKAALAKLRAERATPDPDEGEGETDADAEADELEERQANDDLERAIPDSGEFETR